MQNKGLNFKFLKEKFLKREFIFNSVTYTGINNKYTLRTLLFPALAMHYDFLHYLNIAHKA